MTKHSKANLTCLAQLILSIVLHYYVVAISPSSSVDLSSLLLHQCDCKIFLALLKFWNYRYYFEHKFLDDVARKICNSVRGVNRVVQDITSKPPSTIEWEWWHFGCLKLDGDPSNSMVCKGKWFELFDVLLLSYLENFMQTFHWNLMMIKFYSFCFFSVCCVHSSYLHKKVYISCLSHNRSDLAFVWLEKK